MLPETVFNTKVLERQSGYISFSVSGDNAKNLFAHETGGHRVQRVPPNEKKGRRHTSTITVAVLSDEKSSEVEIDPKDLRWKFCRGSGKGGQHRNKTDSAVQLTHIPTGMSVRCENERDQHKNKKMALKWLTERMSSIQKSSFDKKQNNTRKTQVGSGMRADKIRTIRMQDNIVSDHITGKKISFSRYEKGEFNGLF